jgi:hypothetical protein
MGMFSEANAEYNAVQLEKILIEAIGQGGEIKEFAKKHLYNWYLNECAETWGSYQADKAIIQEFTD